LPHIYKKTITQLLGKPNNPLGKITVMQDSHSNKILNCDGNNTVRLYQKFIAFCSTRAEPCTSGKAALNRLYQERSSNLQATFPVLQGKIRSRCHVPNNFRRN
jgi:hypothetical protein